MIRVTRRYHLSASHRLHSAELTEEENSALYGKCSNPYGHGHNYQVEISVRGPVDAESGRAVDLQELDRLVRTEILDSFDYKNLNTEVPEFQNVVPTTENLALEIRRRLQVKWLSSFPGAWPVLERVRIAETAKNIFEVNGIYEKE